MAETEGVIQFNCRLATPNTELHDDLAGPLLAWRAVLRRLKLIGQSDERYDGLGFGNISRRVPGSAQRFLIHRQPDQRRRQCGCRAFGLPSRVAILGRFQVEAAGALPPSSETLTHAMLYANDLELNWVLHGHCPEIWQHAEATGVATVGADVGYGSPQMAAAVADLLDDERAPALGVRNLGPTRMACSPAGAASRRRAAQWSAPWLKP